MTDDFDDHRWPRLGDDFEEWDEGRHGVLGKGGPALGPELEPVDVDEDGPAEKGPVDTFDDDDDDGLEFVYRVAVRCPCCPAVVGHEYRFAYPRSATHQDVELEDGRRCRSCGVELRWPDQSAVRAAADHAKKKERRVWRRGSGRTAQVRAVRV